MKPVFIVFIAIALLLTGVSPALADTGCASEAREVTTSMPACDPTPVASDDDAPVDLADPTSSQAETLATDVSVPTVDSSGDLIPFVEEVTAPPPAPALLFSDEDLANATQP